AMHPLALRVARANDRSSDRRQCRAGDPLGGQIRRGAGAAIRTIDSPPPAVFIRTFGPVDAFASRRRRSQRTRAAQLRDHSVPLDDEKAAVFHRARAIRDPGEADSDAVESCNEAVRKCVDLDDAILSEPLLRLEQWCELVRERIELASERGL